MPTMPATKEALERTSSYAQQEENEAEYIQYKERSRTSWALLAALALVVILAVVFAFSNLLGLSNVSFDEDDGPCRFDSAHGHLNPGTIVTAAS